MPLANVSIDQILRSLAAKPCNAVAAICGDKYLSYGSLDRRSDHVATMLRDVGVGSESLVILPAERSIEVLVGLIAIWKAGGAVLPINPSHPSSWIDRIVRVASPKAVLLGRDGRRGPFSGNVPQIDLVPHDSVEFRRPDPAPRHPQAAAYCMFTSGTTGDPKAVIVPDSALVNHCMAMESLLQIGPGEKVLNATPLTIDAALEEILPCLLAGAVLVIPDAPLVPGPQLTSFVDRNHISVVSLATSIWEEWLSHPGATDWDRPADLRMVFVGGERVHAAKLMRWQSLAWTQGIEWLTDYGPTEATISCTVWKPAGSAPPEPLPIGLPIDGATVAVRDSLCRPVPDGQVGVLWLGGESPARGYLNQPALTADSFRPDPDGLPGSRIYNSGDFGWKDDAGLLHFTGRQDQQIKLRGIRIELDQIEDHLLHCLGVRDAAVVAIGKDSPEARIVACVALVKPSTLAGVKEELAQRLPAAMVPETILAVPDIPRSGPAQKIDRDALRRIASSRPTCAAGETCEDIVRQFWSEAIGHAPMNEGEAFFAAGGDSLRGLRLLRRLHEHFGVDLGYDVLISGGSVGELSQAITQRRNNAADPSAPVNIQPPRNDVHDPTRGQERLWYLECTSPGSVDYSLPIIFDICGELDTSGFTAAINQLVNRHEALRSVFEESASGPQMRVLSELEIATSHFRATDQKQALSLLHAEMQRPFNLKVGPLVASCLVELSSSRRIWLLNVHHAIADAWSLDLLMHELSELLHERPLAAKPCQLRDFADLEASYLATEADRDRAFWASNLFSLPAPLEIAKGSAPTGNNEGGEFVPLQLDEDLTTDVRRLGRQMGTSAFVIMLAGFAASLFRWTLQERFLIGVPAACRTTSASETIVGFLTNTLPLLVEVDEHKTFAQLVREMAQRLGGAIAHQMLPLDEIFVAVQGQEAARFDGLIRTMFVMHDTPISGNLDLPGCKVRELALHNCSAKMDLTVTLRSHAAELLGGIEFDRTLLTLSQGEGFAAAMLQITRAAIAQPEQPIGRIASQSSCAAQAMVERANATSLTPKPPATLVDGFLRSARLSPDSIALRMGEQSMSYRRIEELSGRFAAGLAKRGVRTEMPVGICMERSFDYVVALLGVLRVGAAFVPLSPSAPAAHKARLIVEGKIEHVVIDGDLHKSLNGVAASLWRPDEIVGDAVSDLQSIVPGQLAYCYFTSGSTGTPKAVALDHQCAVSRLHWIIDRYAIGPGKTVLHKTPLIFDVAIWEIFAPLAVGGQVLLAKPRAEADPFALQRLIEEGGAHLVHFVPSMLNTYLVVSQKTKGAELRFLQLSGESPRPDAIYKARDQLAVEIHNCYGQTETSEATCWEDDGGILGKRVPIGSQVGIYRVLIVDNAWQAVADGVCGELAVAAVGGLARGYQGNPRLTAARFVPNPFPLAPGERLYLTGDWGFRNAHGAIELIGRKDAQRKIRGCRVEPAEIELSLSQIAGVRSVAVCPSQDRQGEIQLVAYYVGDAATAELADRVQLELPAYMRPAAFVRMEELPLTATGKLDLAALPQPLEEHFHVAQGGGVLIGPLEIGIGEEWSSVLSAAEIRRNENFFSVGGNSLSAIRTIARLKARFGIDISVRDFFERPTIAAFAEFVDAALISKVAAMSPTEVEALAELAGRE